MKKRWVVLIAILIAGIIVGVFAAVNAGGGTNISQPTPVVSTPTPNQSPPTTTNVTTPATTTPTTGIIEITAEKLVRDLIANPNKYQKGTILQVSGTLSKDGSTLLDSKIKTSFGTDFYIVIVMDPLIWQDQKLNNALHNLNIGDQVVVKGTYLMWNPHENGVASGILLGVYLENVSLVSAAPTK